MAADRINTDLGLRIARLSREQAVRDALTTYCKVLDYVTSGDEVARLFAPDGVLDVVQDNPVIAKGTRYEHGVLHRGRKQIAAFYDTLVPVRPNPVAGSHHFVSNIEIQWDGEEAVVDSLFLIVMADAEDLGPYIMTGATKVAGYGRYIDRMVCSDGDTWQFKVRQIRFEAGRTMNRQR